MAEKGWIKLHRKVLDCWIWQEKPYDKARAWVDLLLLAMHRDKKLLIDNEIVVISRGSFMTSILKLATRWGWSRNKVKRFLELLEDEQMLNTKRTPKGTLVTIIKYEDYQVCDTTDEPTHEPMVEPTNEPTDRPTGEPPLEPTDEPQKKNIKNIKNEKNNNYCSEPKKDLASEPPLITLTLNDKTEYPVYQADVDEWKELYPSVDVIQQLRYMKAWCDSNPAKRKTSRGIKRFITSWLMKEQDRGGGYSAKANNKSNCVLDKYLKGGK